MEFKGYKIVDNPTEQDVRDFCIWYRNNFKNVSHLERTLKKVNYFDVIDNWESSKIGTYYFIYKFYWFLNNIHDFKKCKVCGKPITTNINNLYALNRQTYCSGACVTKDKDIQEKVKQTNLKNLGCEYPQQNEQVRTKKVQTCLEKYGVECVSKVERFKEKVKQTSIKKYGTEYPQQTDLVKEKIKKTNLDRYGVVCSLQNEEVKKKTKLANLKKYGCDSHKTYDAYYNYLMKNHYDYPNFTLEEFNNRKSFDEPLSFICKKCGREFFAPHVESGYHTRCPICYQNGTSDEEHELFEYIKSFYNGEIVKNNRSVLFPNELDIYIPEKHLAIEFDGLYWHSHIKKQNDYHLTKTIGCEKHDIHLIHIFENEWICKKQIVQNYLKSLLGVYDKTIYARKCIVKELDNKLANEFLEEQHLQGKVPSTKVALGLFYNDKLVACMTFCKSRVNKNCEWELSRFVCKGGYHIPGGASKLLKYFERNYKPKNLVSYADRRWSYSKNNLYLTLGFELISYGKPDYFYSKETFSLYHKMNFRKDKIKKKFPEIYDGKLTETEMMDKLGYFRIYDCGKMTFIKNYVNE